MPLAAQGGVRKGLEDRPVLPDDRRGSNRQPPLLVHHVEAPAELPVRVGDQGKPEILLAGELLLGVEGVDRAAGHLGAEVLELVQSGLELEALSRSPRGVGLHVEEQDERARRRVVGQPELADRRRRSEIGDPLPFRDHAG